MRRLPPLLLALLTASCAARDSASAAPIVSPNTTLTGSFAGQPFAARSVLLVKQTRWNNGRVTTTIVAFERAINCADAVNLLLAAVPGERTLEIRLGVPWPVAPGSQWLARVGEDEWSRPAAATITFMQYGSDATGRDADGQIVVDAASQTGGRLSIRASGRDDASVAGELDFTVCP